MPTYICSLSFVAFFIHFFLGAVGTEEEGKTILVPRTLEESINEIQRLMEVVKKVECITEINCVPCGAFELRVQDAKNTLIEHAKALATALVRGLVDRGEYFKRRERASRNGSTVVIIIVIFMS